MAPLPSEGASTVDPSPAAAAAPASSAPSSSSEEDIDCLFKDLKLSSEQSAPNLLETASTPAVPGLDPAPSSSQIPLSLSRATSFSPQDLALPDKSSVGEASAPLASRVPPPASSEMPQTLLILVGLIGSGKSTFADELEQSHGWVRCNQDDMGGDRRAVERKVSLALRQNRSVVVDRTNFSPQQRSIFLRLIPLPSPRNPQPVRVLAIHLLPPPALLHSRLSARTGHPTISTYAQAQEILRRFERDMVPPEPAEGFERVLTIKEEVPIGTAADAVARCWEQGRRKSLWSEGGWQSGSPQGVGGPGRGGMGRRPATGSREGGGQAPKGGFRSDGNWRK